MKCGRVYNGTPRGTEGPEARFLQSRPCALGLVFGFFGEWSRELDFTSGSLQRSGAEFRGGLGVAMVPSRPGRL